MLAINHLSVSVDDHRILDDLSLTVRAGEVHAIMGPNGSGKSTLTKVVAGHPAYTITAGTILFRGKDLTALPPEERATGGIFIGFQYPVEVPGVNNADFLRMALNAKRKARKEPELDAKAFAPILRQRMEQVELDEVLKDRELNAGFSGGQKKRNEILQMMVLEPDLAILDETDSGLDIDALRIVARGINAYRSSERAIVLITHYQRLLDLVVPDQVHVLSAGRIVKSGGKELAAELESKGYDWLDRT
ncbi:MAG: Fe-S cluster assembly ATPase SufC [Planctomycetes bacterium]|nr:Fe-S cluster assembly ATPase SufC [Planctomycetota bacterium]